MSRARAALALLVALSLACAACGATPPQAPPVQANRVASALTGIAEACGEAFQQRALPRFGQPSQGPSQEALARAPELARAFVLGPGWIYQGETLRQVVALADARLQECGLTAAARALRAQTATAR